MSIGAVATGPIGRPLSAETHSPWRHALSLLIVAGAVAVLEFPITDFDHGTHLLVVLTLVIGIALLMGPGPATTGFATGGTLAGIASIITVDGAFASPHAYVQLLAYLLAGVAVIALTSTVARSRRGLVGRTELARAPVAAPVGPVLAEALTARELEVLRLAATGITVDGIADRLFVSPNTVKTHLTHIYGKLGARGRSEAIRVALHCGCLDPEDICPHITAHGPAESPLQVMPEHPNR
ncbi:MAG TPA: helix-turn-helix transcriptional regulator [Candidatus Limnocylindrales bacterium]|nr:helix-turn-helix transcriptional regulator [Candidatus Limnocylindrales bacterium]